MAMRREDLHHLVDELAEEDVPVVRRVLQGLRGGRGVDLEAILDAAPPDDEAASAAENRAVAEARAAVQRGDTLSADDVRRVLHP